MRRKYLLKAALERMVIDMRNIRGETWKAMDLVKIGIRCEDIMVMRHNKWGGGRRRLSCGVLPQKGRHR